MPTPSESQKNLSRRRPVAHGLVRLLREILKLALAVLVIVAAVLVYRYQVRTSPRAGRATPPRQAKLVEVIPVHSQDCLTTVTGIMGPVIPAQRVVLQPQVAGKIVEISEDLVPGNIVRAGQKLMAIDRRDYDILVKQRHSDVVKATRDLKVEQGNQAIARQEYELLGEVVTEDDQELVLRRPQLASAQAALDSAQAALDKARLDLARCDIVAPFNAVILDKHVDLGAVVGVNSQLLTLVGTDQAWIEAKVRIDQLKWLDIPRANGDPASKVRIEYKHAWGPDRFRTGSVVRLHGDLEAQGQLAKLLIAVDDPFCLKPENHDQPQLLIGSLVNAVIEGRLLKSVFAVDWSHLRDNDTLWIMNDENKLEIRNVEIVFRGPEYVCVSRGLVQNERLVATDIAAPVAGMPLRITGGQHEQELQADRPHAAPKRPISAQVAAQAHGEGESR